MLRPPLPAEGLPSAEPYRTTVLSLAAIRRLRFPLAGKNVSDPSDDTEARVVLAALALLGAALTREEGADLRSRCQLVPTEQVLWELLDVPGQETKQYVLDADTAVDIFNEAVKRAKKSNLPWEGKIELTPHPDLIELVRRSQELEAKSETEETE